LINETNIHRFFLKKNFRVNNPVIQGENFTELFQAIENNYIEKGDKNKNGC
jgi:hypothetical protein